MRFLVVLASFCGAVAHGASDAETPLGGILDKFSPSWIEGRGAAPESKPPPAPPVSNAGGGDGPRPLGYKLPMCFLVDERAPEGIVNVQMENLYKAYAACDVAIVGVVTTLKGNYQNAFGGNAEALTKAAREACNLNAQYGTRGAIQIFTADAGLPKAMCRDPGATGCSTLCEPLSVSMVGPGADLLVGVHESMHSNCCGRVCVNRGEGIERAGPGIDLAARASTSRERHAEEGGRLQNEPISAGACASIRAGATKSAGDAYDTSRQRIFYAHAESDSRKLDLTQRKSVFEPRDPPKRVVLQDPSTLSPEFEDEQDYSGTFGGAKQIGSSRQERDRVAGPGPGDATSPAAAESAAGHGRGPELLRIDESVTADKTLAQVGMAGTGAKGNSTVAKTTAGKREGRSARTRRLKRQGDVVSARDVPDYSVSDGEDPDLSPYD